MNIGINHIIYSSQGYVVFCIFVLILLSFSVHTDKVSFVIIDTFMMQYCYELMFSMRYHVIDFVHNTLQCSPDSFADD